MNCDAVIFDFDGVIGKTMEDNYQAWDVAFRNIGIVIDQDLYLATEGMKTKGVAEMFLAQHGADSSLMDEVVNFKERYYLENNRFEFYPGVLELLQIFSKRFQLGLVSGAGFGRLKMTMPPNVLKLFSAVVTGDHVEHSKPHPEPYRKAVEIIGCEQRSCVAIENSPYGITSAKNAGLYCIAICSTLDRKYLSEADLIVNNVVDIDRIIPGQKNSGEIYAVS
jgi:HAD superfamily hydrolase (TIGR01509 family)